MAHDTRHNLNIGWRIQMVYCSSRVTRFLGLHGQPGWTGKWICDRCRCRTG